MGRPKLSNTNLPKGITKVNDHFRVRISYEGVQCEVGTWESLTHAKAAHDIPQTQPLNLEAVIEHDATTAYKKATESLSKLAAFASCFDALQTLHNIPSALNDLLPIITITGTQAEIVDNLGSTQNTHQLTETNAVRRLAKDAATNMDLTIINIARGHYAGVTLQANHEVNTVALAAQRAFQRTKDPQVNNVTVMR